MYTEAQIVEMLENNPKAVVRAIVAIYNRQTQEEQNSGDTIHNNGIGFSGADAKIGSYMAKYAIQTGATRFTGKFAPRALHIAKKYRKQLVQIANEKNLVGA